MSPPLVFMVLAILFYYMTQLGGRLSARGSLTWWASGIFAGIATVNPGLLRGVADFFGIQLVSNFVLATLIFFLYLTGLLGQVDGTAVGSRARDIATALAALSFNRSRRPTTQTLGRPRALIVLPCFNESATLPRLLPQLEALCRTSYLEFELEYCVVDDVSTDATPALLTRLAPINHVRHCTNLGVAGVLLTGFRIASRLQFDYVVQCDSDGQHPVASIPALLRAARDRQLDVTIGSRFVTSHADGEYATSAALQGTTRLRRLGSLYLAGLIKLFGWARCSDPTSGFRVYSRVAMAYLETHMPEEYPEPESIGLLAAARLNIGEVPVTMVARTAGKSSLQGWKSAQYMAKVSSALVGLRIRSFLRL